MAAPSKLTPDTQARIVQALRLGATFELAAQYGGVSYDTFNNWRKRGEAELDRMARARKRTDADPDELPFVQFFEATKAAEADAVVGWLAKIEKAASDGNWQAAAWKLERRYPRDYGRTVQEVSGPDGGALQVRVVYDDEVMPLGNGDSNTD
jgi:hypothetical protein